MRRILATAVLAVACAAFLLAGGAAGGDEGTYEVRAVFDNAAFLVEGEDVRVAGAKIGSVASVDIAEADEAVREDGSPAPGKAIVIMRIDDPAFHDFRADASCLIRPQSLIGEKFVECTPTEPRAPGTPAPPELEQVPEGEPGEGQYLLPLERNGKAIDLDLVNNIMEEPYPDRFRLILNDLGAGFAARGDELAEIVERANPALRETNRVLAILRDQNRSLADLATDGEQVMTALARERESVAGFINSSEVVGAATASRRADLEAGFAKLPGFLRELRSTMIELSRFSDAATPVFSRLGDAAPSLTRLNRASIPFSSAGIGAITSLGSSAERSGPALVASDPVIRQVRKLANDGAPATKNLAKLLRSLRETGGFEEFLKTLYGLGGAVNAFDGYGHFLRAVIPLNQCFDYYLVQQAGCLGQFFFTAQPTERAAVEPTDDASRSERRRARDRPTDDGSGEGTAPDADAEPEPAVPEAGPEAEPAPVPAAPETEAQPFVPDAPPAEPDPSGELEVQPGAVRKLLDFLVGEPAPRGEGKR